MQITTSSRSVPLTQTSQDHKLAFISLVTLFVFHPGLLCKYWKMAGDKLGHLFTFTAYIWLLSQRAPEINAGNISSTNCFRSSDFTHVEREGELRRVTSSCGSDGDGTKRRMMLLRKHTLSTERGIWSNAERLWEEDARWLFSTCSMFDPTWLIHWFGLHESGRRPRCVSIFF